MESLFAQEKDYALYLAQKEKIAIACRVVLLDLVSIIPYKRLYHKWYQELSRDFLGDELKPANLVSSQSGQWRTQELQEIYLELLRIDESFM